ALHSRVRLYSLHHTMETPDSIEIKADRKDLTTSNIQEVEKANDVEDGVEQEAESEESESEDQYPNFTMLALTTVALMVAVFLVALDVHILGMSMSQDSLVHTNYMTAT